MSTCPGQDTRYWKTEDIFEIACGGCGQVVEFFKTDGARRCVRCGKRVMNPRISIGCARWCKQAKECLGYDPAEHAGQATELSLVDELIAAIKHNSATIKRASAMRCRC